jgi:hypothetical protein
MSGSGRPQRLNMTPSEFNILSVLVTRLRKQHAELPKKEAKKGYYLLVKELQELVIKAKIKEGGLVAMPIQRKHLRLIEELVDTSLKKTVTVVENYQERQKTRPLDPTAFDRHIMNLRHIQAQLLTLKQRIEVLL